MGYSQSRRRMRITAPRGGDALMLTSLEGFEAISEPFQFRLSLLADLTLVEPDKIAAINWLSCGETVTISLQETNLLDDSTRLELNGIVIEIEELRRDEKFLEFEAIIVPKLWLSKKIVQSRIFQQQSVPEILAQVLPGQNFTFELSGTYEPRNFCVQYRESNFDFASRLMEEEGIYYFFRHSKDDHQMVLTDSMHRLPDIAGDKDVLYDPVAGGVRNEMRIDGWRTRQQLCGTKTTLWDHSFQLPGQNLEAWADLQDRVEVGKIEHELNYGGEPLEDYDYPGRYAVRYDGVGPGGGDRQADLSKIFQDNVRTARIRMEAEAAGAIRCSGTSDCVTLVPGHKFNLSRHYNADGEYLLLRVEHSARLSANFRSGGEDEGLDYQNRFVCQPTGLPYRPPRITPRPRIIGTQTATVVGPAGRDVFCDKYGRIKVQFHWDRQGKNNGQSSCWLRVAQLWAGNRWGAFFWPRVGQEVVVAFEEGDPDLPLVLGCVYNAHNMPPFEMPGNSLVNGIKSCSLGGDPSGEFNGVVFYDQPGKEHVQVHSERHELHNSENSRRVQVGKTHTRVIGALSLPGSGRGGGDGEGEGGESGGESGGEGGGEGGESSPFSWKGTEVVGSWCKDLELVIGEKVDTLLGVSMGCTIGAGLETVLNPIGLIAQLGSAPNPLLGGIAGTFGGKTALIIGSESKMVYGPETHIHHGVGFEAATKKLGGTTIAAGVVAALQLANGIIASIWTDEADERISMFTGTAIVGIAMTLLSTLENVHACAEMAEEAEKKAAAAEQLLENTREAQNAVNVAEMAVRLAGIAISTADDAVTSATGASAAAAGAQAAADRTEASLNDRVHVVDGDYTIAGRNITVQSSPLDGVVPPPGATQVQISATGNLETRGLLILQSTHASTLSTLGGFLSLTATEAPTGATCLFDCGETGSITLQEGPIPLAPRIVLNDEGIKLSVGTASITLNPIEGITLQFDEWRLNLGAMGISLSVAENNIKMTPASIVVAAGDAMTTFSPAMIETVAPDVVFTAEGDFSITALTLSQLIETDVMCEGAMTEIM